MSFIITVYTNEGIIMASDSRTTYSTAVQLPDGSLHTMLGVQVSDSVYKTFLCKNNVGISTCGEASINGKPITGFIEDFISQESKESSSVHDIAAGLINHFSAFSPVPNTTFMVAGYDKLAATDGKTDVLQRVYEVSVKSQKIIPIDTSSSGATWAGEADIFQRLAQDMWLKTREGDYLCLPHYETSFNLFTLQDAINYAEYAIDVTIKTMFFQNRVKTVGGSIDILAIKPDGAFWIKRKELHA